MSWPELQIEHLAGALVVCWLAFGWFCWGWGQKVVLPSANQDPAWNWLAGAALLGGLELFTWLALIQSRFESWPTWARTLLTTFVALRGASAGVAAAAWFRRPLSRLGGWCVLLIFGLFAVAFPSLAPIAGGAGWLAVALVFFTSEAGGLSRTSRRALGISFAGLALTDGFTPDLTLLILRLPSEQPLQWGSAELIALTTKSACILAAALVLALAHQPRRWRLIAVGGACIATGLMLGWSDTRAHATLRARIWAELEETARLLGSSIERLSLAPEDVQNPDYIKVVTLLAAREKSSPVPVHYWFWAMRNGMVVHVADVGSLGDRPGLPQTPPGYRYPQLHNFILRAARGERFESGPFFVAGERRMGLHVPVRATAGGAPLAWLQASLPLVEWRRQLSDTRANAIVLLLSVTGVGVMVLAGRTWLEAARRLHERAVESAATAKAKNEMIGLVSHELRTPLQVVLGHLELLDTTTVPAPAQRTLAIVDQQCRQLLSLVNDTLDLCALEVGRLPRRPVRFSPAVLAETVMRDLRPLAAGRGLAFALQLDPQLPAVVEADAARIRQILTNLLANALKYTLTGSVRLKITAEENSDRLVFVVSDSGPGLPATVLARLGEPFHSVSFGQGTGLGLALVHRLCAHLGGEFTATNALEGGCVATVRVPVTKAALDATPAEHSRPVAPEGHFLTGTRIVLAEDNTLVRELFSSHLRSLGAEIEAFANGAVALEACRARPPHAVLLDLSMPGADGRTVARELRALGANKPRLIVGLSAEALGEDEARAVGFDRFLAKPVALSELTALFASALPVTSPVESPSPKLRDIFRQEAPGQLAALHAALTRHDRAEIGRLAHYLQSSAYVLSDEPLRADCAALRQWADSDQDTSAAAPLMQAVESHIRRLLAASP